MRHDNTHECTLDISATAIEPNLDESAEETVAWYNRRRETSENRIKELKIRFRQCAGGSIQWPEKLCVMLKWWNNRFSLLKKTIRAMREGMQNPYRRFWVSRLYIAKDAKYHYNGGENNLWIR